MIDDEDERHDPRGLPPARRQTLVMSVHPPVVEQFLTNPVPGDSIYHPLHQTVKDIVTVMSVGVVSSIIFEQSDVVRRHEGGINEQRAHAQVRIFPVRRRNQQKEQ